MQLVGPQRFAIFLCQVQDKADFAPHPIAFYEDLFVNRNTGGLNDYWVAASLGAISLDGSEVFGWRALDLTEQHLNEQYPSRWGKILAAFAAFPEVKPEDYAGYVALFNIGDVDSGNQNQGVVAGMHKVNMAFLAHEMGHAMGFEHSFDDSDRIAVPEWPSMPGEYFDMFDIMSAERTYSDSGHRFSPRGPLMNVANMDRAGWLPPHRVQVVGGGSSDRQTVDIVALEHPEVPGFLALRAGGCLFEFRINDGFDAGLPQPTILIHDEHAEPNSHIVASDPATYNHHWLPGQTHGDTLSYAVLGGTKVTVESFDLQRKTARLAIQVKAVRKNIIPHADAQVDFGLGTWQWPIDELRYMIRDGRIQIQPPLDTGHIGHLVRAAIREQVAAVMRDELEVRIQLRTRHDSGG